MNVVKEAIATAISQGAPAYNRGRPDECYRIYKETGSGLLETGVVPTAEATVLKDALSAASQQSDPDAQAWTMRRAFDSILDGSAALRASISTQLASGATEFPIVSYDSAAAAASGPQWYAMDDVIMGGVSSSSAAYDAAEQALVFAGHVTTDSGGGFASVRSRPWAGWQSMGAAKGVRMTVKGDGRVYKLSLKCDDGYDGVQYQGDFATSGSGGYEEVALPFAHFTPNLRGRALTGVAPLQPQLVRQVGLMVSKFAAQGGTTPGFRSGAFRLALRSMRGFV